MPKFNLTSGANNYTLDTDGTFSLAGGTSGKWSVHDSGDVRLQAAGAADVRIPVAWSFTADNQLIVKQGATLAFNFHTAGLSPLFRLAANVLEVRPSIAQSFEFTVPFTWKLEANCNLTAQLGATQSTLDGFVDDKRGRMVFFFSDKKRPSSQYFLVFSGEWSRSADPAHADQIRLVFTYKQKGVTASFVLPSGADVKDNRLTFSYQKSGTTRGIQLLGSVRISDNFDVTFSIAQQTYPAGGEIVKATTITVQTAFVMKNLSGALELTLANSNQTLAISGSFNASIGPDGKLSIDFNYAKEKDSGALAKLSIAIGGSFTTNDGTTFTFSYTRATTGAQVYQVSGAGQIGSAAINGGLQVSVPGLGQRTVTGFLQLSW